MLFCKIDNLINKVSLERIRLEFEEIGRIRRNSTDYWNYELNSPGDYYSLKAFDYFKCIFVHIPKTAGVSVSKTLFGNLAGGHKTILWYRNYYSSLTFRRYFKFTFVRNPWSRLFSAYSFLKAGGMTQEDKDWSESYLNRYESFEKFIMEWISPENIMSYLHFAPQVYFICDEKKKLLVDYVGKFEKLSEDYRYVSKKIGVTSLLDHYNRSIAYEMSWKDQYSSKMKRVVKDIYNDDIVAFGYDE